MFTGYFNQIDFGDSPAVRMTTPGESVSQQLTVNTITYTVSAPIPEYHRAGMFHLFTSDFPLFLLIHFCSAHF